MHTIVAIASLMEPVPLQRGKRWPYGNYSTTGGLITLVEVSSFQGQLSAPLVVLGLERVCRVLQQTSFI